MTARTPASLSPHSVNLGLNFLSGHGLSGQRVQLLEHSTQVLAATLSAELFAQQLCQAAGLQQRKSRNWESRKQKRDGEEDANG
jgi:hypothetical protein